MTAPSSYSLTSCQPFRPANSPAISRRTLLTTQKKLEAVTRGINNHQEHHKLTDTGKAQLNTRGKRTEFLSIQQAEDRVLYLLYPSTVILSPVIFVHYESVTLANTSSAQASGTTTTLYAYDAVHAPAPSGSFSSCNPVGFVQQCCRLTVVPNAAVPASRTQLSKSSSVLCLTFNTPVCREAVTQRPCSTWKLDNHRG